MRGNALSIVIKASNFSHMVSDIEICKKLLPWFELYFDEKVQTYFSPELKKETPHDERIELCAVLENRTIAFEHTNVAPFVDFETVNASTKYAEQELQSTIMFLKDGERLDIGLPREWKNTLASGTKRKFLRGVADAAKTNLRQLREMDHRERYYVTIEVCVLGISVTLRHRYSEILCGVTVSLFFNSETLEAERTGRFETKLPSKLDKLKKWKDKDCSSVLVLEDRDIQLSNTDSVSEALKVFLERHENRPDFVFYVSGSPNGETTALPIKCPRGWNWSYWSECDKERFFPVG